MSYALCDVCLNGVVVCLRRVSWWKCACYCDVLVLPMCILISCSSVLGVLMALGMFMFVKVMSTLISVIIPLPSLFVFHVCAYGGVVVSVFDVLAFYVNYFLYFFVCNDVWLSAVYKFFLVPGFCF